MESMQYKYEARVSVDAWWVKLYAWAWRADKEQADFCKLCWGYIGMIPNLMIRAILFPFWIGWKGLKIAGKATWAIIKRMADFFDPYIESFLDKVFKGRSDSPMEPVLPPRQRSFQPGRPARPWRFPKFSGDAFLTKVSATASKVITTGQRATPYLHWLRWPLIGFFYALMAGFALAIALVVGWSLYNLVALVVEAMPMLLNGAWIGLSAAAVWLGIGVWFLLPILGITLGVCCVALAMIAGVGHVHRETEVFTTVGNKTVRTTSSFFGAMRTGVWGIKRNTCPKIVMVKEEHESKG